MNGTGGNKGQGGASNACPSGKIAYGSRADARAAAMRARKRGEHCRPYRCPRCDLIHIGHLPPAVVAGEVSATEFYNRGA